MSIIKEQIFQNRTYTAYEMKDGSLLVEKNKKNYSENRPGGCNGRHLVGENGPIWVDSIKTAIDTQEAAALCRALFQS